ncbi:pimeloyl-ACP methyl ester carboxylesterase [Aneurinibacillus soli]|uniref:2-succinyl-6-hydroxy-2, 4-cyclohexadiene-1-carboxylate synthase n=1 Tax=Aneurinibacillus soli TaxID=1500254 RepID=A0A0U5B5K3_9BACL|nr:alpha/beta hydrolase [Aneurinibacillus soli]PYE57809.1 pimeloyl-ACP methyl ester carboxylesterase [Aneurinibacillus soli]BAU26236.1 2-succinyl-6-hydroxy-2, 4-cyclohexadiene-1-carboxylate synthase [Aneurinibacillus soli]
MAASEQLPFVFIHGAGGTKAKYRGIETYLEGAPIHIIELPGHGDNEVPYCTTIEQQAAWLQEQLGEEDVILVGHSMGGLVGIELVARTSHVKGLVLNASHYEMPVHPKILAELEAGTFPDMLFTASYGKDASVELIEEERAQLSAVPMDVTHADFAACSAYKGEDTFRSLTVPILALYGTEDRLLPKGAKEKAVVSNERVNAIEIEGASHYIMLEKPEAFAKALLSFRKDILAAVQ